MIGSTRQVRVFAFAAPTDLRNGFDGLWALVSQKLAKDVLAGDLFLFVGRSRKLAKVLFWDGTGLVVYAKRLEKGRFNAPWNTTKDGAVEMTVSELALFLEGSHLAGRIQLSPAPFVLGSVFADAQQRR